MHCISNPFPTYTPQKGHPSSQTYCKQQYIKDSIDLRNKYGYIQAKEPLEIRKTNVLGYSTQKKKQDYKSQIFFQTPDFISQKQKPTQRPQSSVNRPMNQAKVASSNQSRIGSTSYLSDSPIQSPVKITIKLKASHTDKSKLKKFQDKLTIVDLKNGMIQITGLVPLRIANMFKIIFQDSQFHLQKVTY